MVREIPSVTGENFPFGIFEYWNKTNHWSSNCYLKNQRVTSKKVEKGDDCNVSILANKHNPQYTRFIVDSGSTNHLINNKDLLSNSISKKVPIGLAKENEFLFSERQSEVELQNCKLNDALYAKDLEIPKIPQKFFGKVS